jgi:hypothetical protein
LKTQKDITDSLSDQTGNTTIQGLTAQIAPVLQKALGPPEEQLDAETRAQLLQLVEFLKAQG